MRHWTGILADETIVTQTILVDGQVAGNLVSWEHSGEQEVGYWLGQEYWGQGVATQALAALDKIYEHAGMYPELAEILRRRVEITMDSEGLTQLHFRLARVYTDALATPDHALTASALLLDADPPNHVALHLITPATVIETDVSELNQLVSQLSIPAIAPPRP